MNPNEQLYWDGQAWVTRRRWTAAGWIDEPLQPAARSAPTAKTTSTPIRPLVWVIAAVAAIVVILGVVVFIVGGTQHSKQPSADSTKYSNGNAAARAACIGFFNFYNHLIAGQIETPVNLAQLRNDIAPMQPAAHKAAQLEARYQTLSNDADAVVTFATTTDFGINHAPIQDLVKEQPIRAMFNDCTTLPEPTPGR